MLSAVVTAMLTESPDRAFDFKQEVSPDEVATLLQSLGSVISGDMRSATLGQLSCLRSDRILHSSVLPAETLVSLRLTDLFLQSISGPAAGYASNAAAGSAHIEATEAMAKQANFIAQQATASCRCRSLRGHGCGDGRDSQQTTTPAPNQDRKSNDRGCTRGDKRGGTAYTGNARPGPQ